MRWNWAAVVGSGLVVALGVSACGGGTPKAAQSATQPSGDAGRDAKAMADTGAPMSARLFPAPSTWYQEVGALAADRESGAMIAALAASGGFGAGALLVDFEFEVVTADDRAPSTPFTPGPEYFRPDCDEAPVPLAPGGALQGESGYQCTRGGECRLLVHHLPSQRLFELWKANVTGGVLTAGCLAVWDLRRVYGPSGRGADCASADSAGLPIAPLLFTADEVAAGEIAHALRLSLPPDRIRGGVYLVPATHSTRAATGGPAALPLGARLRLRGDFPVEGLTSGARVVARALQRYGMFLADGAPRALAARTDRATTAKWATLLGEQDLAALQATDFEVVDGGARIPYRGECLRAP